METNNEIQFLDLLIQKQEDISLTFSVFRKSTHTNNYLSMDTGQLHLLCYNPLNYKIAIFHRASTLCTKEILAKELKKSENAPGHLKYLKI